VSELCSGYVVLTGADTLSRKMKSNIASDRQWSTASVFTKKKLRDGLLYCDVMVRITVLLPPSQIRSHSKNLGESKHFNFDQIYMIVRVRSMMSTKYH